MAISNTFDYFQTAVAGDDAQTAAVDVLAWIDANVTHPKNSALDLVGTDLVLTDTDGNIVIGDVAALLDNVNLMQPVMNGDVVELPLSNGAVLSLDLSQFNNQAEIAALATRLDTDIAANAAGITANATAILATGGDAATNASDIAAQAATNAAQDTAITGNAADITANAAAQAGTDTAQDAAIAAEGATNSAQSGDIATNASDIAAQAGVNAAQDADIVANAAAIAAAGGDATANTAAISALETENTAQDASIAANAQGLADAATAQGLTDGAQDAALAAHVAADLDTDPTNELYDDAAVVADIAANELGIDDIEAIIADAVTPDGKLGFKATYFVDDATNAVLHTGAVLRFNVTDGGTYAIPFPAAADNGHILYVQISGVNDAQATITGNFSGVLRNSANEISNGSSTDFEVRTGEIYMMIKNGSIWRAMSPNLLMYSGRENDMDYTEQPDGSYHIAGTILLSLFAEREVAFVANLPFAIDVTTANVTFSAYTAVAAGIGTILPSTTNFPSVKYMSGDSTSTQIAAAWASLPGSSGTAGRATINITDAIKL